MPTVECMAVADPVVDTDGSGDMENSWLERVTRAGWAAVFSSKRDDGAWGLLEAVCAPLRMSGSFAVNGLGHCREPLMGRQGAGRRVRSIEFFVDANGRHVAWVRCRATESIRDGRTCSRGMPPASRGCAGIFSSCAEPHW